MKKVINFFLNMQNIINLRIIETKGNTKIITSGGYEVLGK